MVLVLAVLEEATMFSYAVDLVVGVAAKYPEVYATETVKAVKS